MYCHRCLKSAQYHSTINQSDSFTNFQNEKNKITSKVQNVRKGKALKTVPTYFLKSTCTWLMELSATINQWTQSLATTFHWRVPLGTWHSAATQPLPMESELCPPGPPPLFLFFMPEDYLRSHWPSVYFVSSRLRESRLGFLSTTHINSKVSLFLLRAKSDLQQLSKHRMTDKLIFSSWVYIWGIWAADLALTSTGSLQAVV